MRDPITCLSLNLGSCNPLTHLRVNSSTIRIGPISLCMTLRLKNQGQIFDPIHLTGSWTLSNLPVLLLLLHLSLLFEAFLWRLLAFLYPFAFLFHNTLLS